MDDIKDWTGLSAVEHVRDSSGMNRCGRRPWSPTFSNEVGLKKEERIASYYRRRNCFRCFHRQQRPCSVDCSPATVPSQPPPSAADVTQNRHFLQFT